MAIKNKDVLRNLSNDKLKQYILYLTGKYYESFKKNDREAYELAIEQLYFIFEEYDDKFVNLRGFVAHCLYMNAIAELNNADGQHSFSLEPLFKMDLLNEDVEELAHDIKNIFNKQRIRERYNAKTTCENVERA